MPATNPRITITLTPEVYALLREISALSGNSQSSFVGQVLSESVPVLQRMVHMLSAANRLKEQAGISLASVAEGLDHAQGRIETQLGLLLDDMDGAARPLLEKAEAVSRRRRRKAQPSAAPARLATPISNRGVTPHPTTGKPFISRRSKGSK
jgi:hypothetical protein